jgi:hypothetical protein
MIKSRRMINIYKILMGKSEEEKPLGTVRRIWDGYGS